MAEGVEGCKSRGESARVQRSATVSQTHIYLGFRFRLPELSLVPQIVLPSHSSHFRGSYYQSELDDDLLVYYHLIAMGSCGRYPVRPLS